MTPARAGHEPPDPDIKNRWSGGFLYFSPNRNGARDWKVARPSRKPAMCERIEFLPRRPSVPCTYPGCPNVAVAGGRCAEHKRATVRRPDGRSSAALGYGYEWQKIRAAFLRQCPQCEWCGAEATEADHIVPLSKGGTHSFDNLRALCKSCHSKRTRQG